jgi:uncharacterized protein
MKKKNLEAPRSCAAFRDSRVIGNLVRQQIGEVLKTLAYKSLVDEENQLKDSICGGCSFVGACDTGPIARNFDSQLLGHCPTERYLYPIIEAFLEQRDFFDQDFAAVAQGMKGAYVEK